MAKNLYKEFARWLDKVLSKALPSNIVAYSFNLYEGGDEQSYHMQLIGSPTYSEKDSEWACNEAFSTGEDVFILDRKTAGQEWQDGLKYMSELAISYFEKGKYRAKLTSARAVGIGFVDGDLHTIFTNDESESSPNKE